MCVTVYTLTCILVYCSNINQTLERLQGPGCCQNLIFFFCTATIPAWHRTDFKFRVATELKMYNRIIKIYFI
jgi:hypothetical protein